MNDFGYYKSIIENMELINEKQGENIVAAAKLMADAIEQDRLISVYGGGGHTTLCMGEMFFRAGGLANINPVMETGLSVFNQALKYLELERTVNYGSAIMKYYDLQPGDLLIVFHNIGINPATIDAVMEAKKAGALAGVEEVICAGFDDLEIFDTKEARDKIVDIIIQAHYSA